MKKIKIEEEIRCIKELVNTAHDDATLQRCLDQAKTLCANNQRSPDAMLCLAEVSMLLDLKDESLRACQEYVALMKQSRDKKTLDRSTVTTLLTICINGFKRQLYQMLLDVCDYLHSEPKFKKDDIIAVRKMLLLENGDVESWLNLSKEMHSRSPYEPLWIMGHEVDIIDVRKMLLEKGDLESWCKLSKEMNSRFPDEPQWFIGSITSLAYRKDLKESYKKMRNLIKRLSQKGKKNNESHLVTEVESFMLHLSILDQEKNYKYAKPILEELKEPEYSFNRYRKRGIMYSEGRILAEDKKCNQAAAEIFKNLFDH